MSWQNPTQEEASEKYYYFRNKYNNAFAQRRSSEKKEEQYIADKKTASSQLNTLSAQKANDEKRIQGLGKIIKTLEDNSGGNVPFAIKKTVNQLKRADTSYKNSIKASGGVSMADIASAFAVKSVDAEPHSASALQQFKSEKARLEQEVIELQAQIASLSEKISTLNGQISACDEQQSSLTSTMNSSAYNMNHYKTYMD